MGEDIPFDTALQCPVPLILWLILHSLFCRETEWVGWAGSALKITRPITEGTRGEDFQAGRKIPETVTGSWRGSLRSAGQLHGRNCSLNVHGRTYGDGRQTVSDKNRTGSAAGSEAGLKPGPRPRISIIHGSTSMCHGSLDSDSCLPAARQGGLFKV